MRFVLTTIGTSGDVLPFIGLGERLVSRGHDVLLVTHSRFARAALDAGVGFAPVGTEGEYLAALGNPAVWGPETGYREVVRCATSLVPDMYGIVQDNIAIPGTVVVAHYLDFASPLIHATFGAPVVTALTSPMGFSFADRYLAQARLPPALDQLRSALGGGWNFSSVLTIGLYPEWFGAPGPAWGGAVTLTGFPLYDGVAPVPTSLTDRLREEPAPIAFTAGPRLAMSRDANGAEFLAAASAACAVLGRPGVVLGALANAHARPVPDNLTHVEYAPLTQVLPHCAAIVHHGGVGTIAAALASGVPQLALPVCHDQPDNSRRMVALGVGSMLEASSYRGDAIGLALADLLGSSERQTRCQELRSHSSGMRALDSACSALEFVGRRASWNGAAKLAEVESLALAGAGGCSCGGACGPGWGN
jgi:rhamnosyltransferase subunit B